MDGTRKVLLLAPLILLVSGQSFENYRELPDKFRKPVNKALEKANHMDLWKSHHVAFHSLGYPRRTMKSNLNINVLLIVTTCEKDSKSAYEHRDECVTRKERTPMIDCVVCKTNDNQELVDCARKIDVINGSRKTIRDKCRNYDHGSAHIMGSVME